MLVVFDTNAFGGGGFSARMQGLVAAIESDPGVRIPGDRRLAARERARTQGISLSSELHAQIETLAKGGTRS
jgi:(2R)-3-sulfolactate dehydrogenase (NADP+)